MNTFPITIDGQSVNVTGDQTILSAARTLGLDIPTLCYLEKCGPLTSCLVCMVKVNGKLVPSCGTKVQPGMVVESETEEVHAARRTALELLFSDHVGDCLSPCQRLCPLGLNIPVMLRQIESGNLAEALRTARGALPLAGVLGRLCHHPCEQGCRRGNWDNPAAIREMELFVTEWERRELAGKVATERPVGNAAQLPYVPPCKPPTGKTVAIVGAGPTGLGAAYYLARSGHRVTLVDRHNRAGGSLRTVAEESLPAAVVESEIAVIARLGVEFKLGVELGDHVTIEGLSRGFDAVLVTTGELAKGDVEKLALPTVATGVKVDPNTCQVPVPKVFAAGAAVKPVKQLVRAIGEGRAAAECVHRFLVGQPVRRPEKVFSSVMGRLDPGELRLFLASANAGGIVSPCDRCVGHNRQEAATESARCLHCDCRSSGNCLLQHYAQVYGAEASRFRSERRKFEQFVQPGDVVFEPGKCILCGICVKLTEMAREPLGLTFIGRGFDVRIGAPLNASIEEALKKTADECVKHCPTGALAWK
ncbi:MAG TPA: FAD-dependent oxidoreductase [Clostridia bacterium]|nr:FAD-dependent oxidoreductase [Clostridia bacterium]